MESSHASQRRLAKNTLMLYVRMFMIMGVTLYTSRVILEALGVDDFGIYSVVSGLVALTAVFSQSMIETIGRFVAFEMGRGEKGRVAEVFGTALMLQAGLAALVALLCETLGMWFLTTRMSVPPERMDAARMMLHASVVMVSAGLLTAPFNAVMMARERMQVFAYIGLVEAVGKLLVAWGVLHAAGDRLVAYAALLTAMVLAVELLYPLYCRRFAECAFPLRFSGRVFREMFGFTGWNVAGSGATLLRDQGVNMLLNVFYGPAVNAARGIAMQVGMALQSFSLYFGVALNPQITKTYAAGEREVTMKLVFQGVRLSYCLLLLLSLPILMEAEAVLMLWLGQAPAHTPNFVRLVVAALLVEGAAHPLTALVQASGRVRRYQVPVSVVMTLNLLAAWLLLRMGLPSESVFALSAVVAALNVCIRLLLLRKLEGLPMKGGFANVVVRLAIVTALSLMPPLLVVTFCGAGVQRLFLTAAVCLVSTILSSFFVGCTREERRGVAAWARGRFCGGASR